MGEVYNSAIIPETPAFTVKIHEYGFYGNHIALVKTVGAHRRVAKSSRDDI